MRRTIIALSLALAACASVPSAPAETAPPLTPALSEAETGSILERTLRLQLAPDLSQLTNPERAALHRLLAAGERIHTLYLAQRHPQGRAAEAQIDAQRADIRDLFRLSSGPIATTLDNRRVPILDVAPETPGKNVYPANAEALAAFLEANPHRRIDLLDQRAVVLETTPQNLAAVRATLARFPAIDTLHPDYRGYLAVSPVFFAVPYSIAYADDIMFIYEQLNEAAHVLETEDAAFARYLRLRARDLLSDDYEGGDAAWVTGTYTGNLNAQIGAYETYDDALYGVKTFFSLSIMVRDADATRDLQRAIAGIQDIENALPYDAHKQVRSNIPVAVYNVVADFGQARGTNTATILPNEAYLARQYGRTILMRGNILRNPQLGENTQREFDAAVGAAHQGDLAGDGGFYRTLWHEIGHYLGVDQTADGRDLASALGDTADLLEEMKADLVSLTAARMLHARGLFTDAQLRSIYASGVRRVLQKSRPRRDQPYQTMQLIQWNWFMDHGLLRFDNGRLAIDYARYPEAVTSLLREVLALQRNGDRDAANVFVDRWTRWDESLHGLIAQNMRATERFRFTLVTYEALDGAR